MAAASQSPSAQASAPADASPLEAKQRGWASARTALFLTIGLRTFYSALAAAFAPFLTLDPLQIRRSITENLIQRDAHPWLYAIAGVWQRFDTIFYIHIAHNGYDAPMPTVFYP